MQESCIFLPRLSQAEFAATAGACDAMLDSIEWSGFNSSLESLAHDLPIVTFNGGFMRGRHSAAIMQRMNINEMVSHSISGYVETAQRLAQDTAYHLSIKAKIANSKSILFKDRLYAEAFNKALLELFPNSNINR
jgi:protein O-GlcNAc transferase